MLCLVLPACRKEHQHEESVHEKKPDRHEEIIRLTSQAVSETGIRTEPVMPETLAGFISIPARVTVNQDMEAHVGTLISGRIRKVQAKLGDYVRAGQTLLVIESLEIGEIKAGYFRAKASTDYTRSNFERQKKLLDDNVGSRKNYQEALSEFEKAKADLKAADEKFHSIGLTDHDPDSTEDHVSGALAVTAPISGLITERNVVTGQMLDPSGTAFKIIDIRSVWIDGSIYEKDIPHAALSSPARFTAIAYPEEVFEGTVTYIGQTIDEKTRTLLVRSTFDNPRFRLRPQMFGELMIHSGRPVPAIYLPGEAIVRIQDAQYVFVQTDSVSFEKRPVETGAVIGNRVEIRKGLSEGETVAVKGVFYLKSELLKHELGEEH